ncbi:MAG: M23 family metallopeptidase [Balneolaceae bacterium]
MLLTILMGTLTAPAVLFGQNSAAPADSIHYLWPTNASTQLSATFAETRSAHLHSGIDIRTWGREGYDVYASRSGVIYRLGMSPSGYGNVIYMKHDDDTYTVYAHLNRFEPELQALADSVRLMDYRAEIDLIIEEKNIRYEKGERIGFTGSTGVGPPHLHFEIRDRHFEPVNPLLYNLSITDTVPPVFRGLAVEYFDPSSLHPIGHERFTPLRTDNGVVFFDTLTVSGPVGLAVNVHDRANRTPNVYAVYEVAMIADGDTLFHSKADQLSFRESRAMFLDRSYPILAESRRGYQRLFVVNGNRLPLYKTVRNRGVLWMEDGEIEINIVASDRNGNRTTAVVPVRFRGAPPPQAVTSLPAYPAANLSTSMVPFRPMAFRDIQPELINGTVLKQPAGPADPEPHSLIPPPGNGQTVAKTLHPGQSASLSLPDKSAELRIPAGALFDTLTVSMRKEMFGSLPRFHFNPSRLPVNESIHFFYRLPQHLQNNGRIGLFAYDESRNRHSFLGSVHSGKYLRANLLEFTELHILEDIHPPWVGTPSIQQNLAGHDIVTVPVTDQMSGIDYRRSSITVNDEPGIIEYDRDKNLLIYYLPNASFGPTIMVDVTVYDGIGNRTERTFPVRR